MTPFEEFPLPITKESSIAYSFPFGRMVKDKLTLLNQKSYDYYYLELSPCSVMVIAVTEDKQIVINREFRQPTKKVLLSLPGGIVDGEESPLEAAKRELLEETGFSASKYEVIGQSYGFPGITQQKNIFVLAKDAKKTEAPALEPSECLQTIVLQEKELLTLMAAGDQDIDGLLCTGLFYLSQYRKKMDCIYIVT